MTNSYVRKFRPYFSLAVVFLLLGMIFWLFLLPYGRTIISHLHHRSEVVQLIENLDSRLTATQAQIRQKLASRNGLTIPVPGTYSEASLFLDTAESLLGQYMEDNNCATTASIIIQGDSHTALTEISKRMTFHGKWKDCLSGLYDAAGSLRVPVTEFVVTPGSDDEVAISIVLSQFAPPDELSL